MTSPVNPGLLLGLRVLLLLCYPFIAHAAGARHDGGLAALALGDILLIVLLDALFQPRAWAWMAVAVALPGLWWLAHSKFALIPLLLVPTAFLVMVAWAFGRTLRAGRTPLISRIVAAVEPEPEEDVAPLLRRYTRGLTLAWALVLGLLAMVNLGLALVAVPGGVLSSLGAVPPVTVTESEWSWFANVFNYGIVAGFFVLEYAYRQRHFPGRYRSFWDFLASLARLGPAFWRDVMR